MEKRIIKAIIAERQQEISKIQLVERPISLLGMKKGQFQGNELDIEVVPVWKWLLRYC